MLRRPSAPATSTGTAVLVRRGSARAARRRTGLDVPATRGHDTATGGVVPRMRRPRAASEPVHARTALEGRIDRHLARLHGTTPTARPGVVDDDRARRDPETVSFAAIRPAAPAEQAPARVATPADRPRTAELPAIAGSLSR